MAESFMEEQLARLGGNEWGKERVAGSVFMGPGGVAVEEAEPEAEGGEQMASSEEAAPETAASEDAGPDPALVAMGEKTFRKCQSCHAVGEGAKNKSGPQLNGLLGRTIGGVEDFKYSNVFQEAAAEGRVWDEESLSGFLGGPKAYFKGTRMSFAGLKSDEDIAAVIAYLNAESTE